MAPEVALCKPYGKGADVFSYSILLWEIISLKIPFKGYNVSDKQFLLISDLLNVGMVHCLNLEHLHFFFLLSLPPTLQVEQHAAKVMNGEKRPKLSKSWPIFICKLLKSCWSHVPYDRPSCSSICDTVRRELLDVEGSMADGDIADRSKHLLDRSDASRQGGG